MSKLGKKMIAAFDEGIAIVRGGINPLHGQRGKHYYAVRCANPQCREKLPLIEMSASADFDAGAAAKRQLINQAVRCPICTMNTPIIEAQIFVLEVR